MSESENEETPEETTVTLPVGQLLHAWAEFEEVGHRQAGTDYAPFTIAIEIRDPNGESRSLDCPTWKDSYQVVSGSGFKYVSFPQCNLEPAVAGEYQVKATRIHRPKAAKGWEATKASLLFTK